MPIEYFLMLRADIFLLAACWFLHKDAMPSAVICFLWFFLRGYIAVRCTVMSLPGIRSEK